MLKKLTYILYRILHFFDFVFKKIFNRSFLVHLKDLIEKDSYTIKSINDNIVALAKTLSLLVSKYFFNFLLSVTSIIS